MKEINRHILLEAIKSLKEKRLNFDLWKSIKKNLDKIDQSDDLNDDILKKSIAQLPTLKAAPDIWDNIESELEKEDLLLAGSILDKAIEDLPQYAAPPGLFDEIVEEINEPKTRVFKFNKFYNLASKIAAAIVLAFGVHFLILQYDEPTTEVTVSYTEEEVTEPNDVLQYINQNEQKDEVLAFVKENCVNIEESCENPKFKGLLSHYIELESAHEELLYEIKMNEEQHQLINYLVRIEKEKTQIGKQLIQLLLS